MAPRIINEWEPPRGPLNQAWRYEYTKIIGQIELKISSDEEPQTRFEGEIFDNLNRRHLRIMHIIYDINDHEWKCFEPDALIRPRPGFLPEFNSMEELADYMVGQAREIEARRNA